MYLISGPSNINLLWKNWSVFTPKAIQLLGMRNVLKLGSNGAKFCELDDSGRGPRPRSGTNVNAENRIWYLTHNSAATYLSGPHLKSLASRFQHQLSSRIEAMSLPLGWGVNTDLYGFLYDVLFPTQVELLFGTSFFDLNPTFAGDFRQFHRGLPLLLRRLPRWLVPKAWDARERCLESIKKWHVWVQEQQASGIALCDEDRALRYGSRFISTRQAMHSKMKDLDADDIASSELGIIWA